MKLSFRDFVGVFCGLWLLSTDPAFAFSLPDLQGLDENGVILAEENVPSNIITDLRAIETHMQRISSTVGGHMRNILRRYAVPRRGGAAGDDDGAFQGVWANSSSTDFKNKFRRLTFDGTNHMLLAGLDFSLAENHLLGVSFISESTDIDTRFNLGSQRIDGVTVAPYYGWSITDNWSLDLGFGLSEMDTDQYRTQPFVTPIIVIPPSGTPTIIPSVKRKPIVVTSKTSGERSFGTLDINGFWTAGDFSLGARLGYLSTKTEQDGYVESNDTEVRPSSLEFAQSYLGFDLAYGARSQPFLGVTLNKDSTSDSIRFASGVQPATDDDSLLIAAGWRYYGEDGISTVLELNTREGKDNYSEDSVSFMLRYDFD